jgi:beta-aspartyl-peptidase (threonine type)
MLRFQQQIILALICLTSLSQSKFTIAVHGGAGSYTRDMISLEREVELKDGILEALKAGYMVLTRNGTHMEATEQAIISLENNPLFNAGKGARINQDLEIELDASMMDGATLQCGGVAAVKKVKNPIKAARLVMEQTPHVLIVGPAMDKLAEEKGLEIVDNSYFFTIERLQEYLKDKEPKSKSGTVGSVAQDSRGNLAAMTSTGGYTNKMSGRVGDSPLIGVGNYANNESMAVSCTGHGEVMMRNVLAYDLHARMVYKGSTLNDATEEIFSHLEANAGGMIVIDKEGNIALPFNTPGMWRGYVREDGKAYVYLFKIGEDYTPVEYDLFN